MNVHLIRENENQNDGSYIHLYRNKQIGAWCAYGYSAYGLRLFDKQQGYMNANDYRLLTGACREGTNHFLQEHDLTWEDTMPVGQVLEITKGQYGFDKFQKAAEQILQD